MAAISTYSCDHCGRLRSAANHWYLLMQSDVALHLSFWVDNPPADAAHCCGIRCLQILVEKRMPALNGAPQPTPQPAPSKVLQKTQPTSAVDQLAIPQIEASPLQGKILRLLQMMPLTTAEIGGHLYPEEKNATTRGQRAHSTLAAMRGKGMIRHGADTACGGLFKWFLEESWRPKL